MGSSIRTAGAVLEGGHATGLECRECGERYGIGAGYACPECFGPLQVEYDRDRVAAAATRERIAAGPPNLWRYAAFLPCAPADTTAGAPTGLTPLVAAPRLGDRLGLRDVWVKDERTNPTHSFKDRVVAVALEAAVQLGYGTVACASTGNLANAVAAQAAARGLDAVVVVPRDLEPAKIAASAVCGATVLAVDGTYDDVNRLCGELSAEWPWAFVNVTLRPYYCEGSTTLAHEIVEQLGWRTPDRCVIPVASGSLYTRIHRGFSDARATGLADGPAPVLHGAQAAGCAPVADAWRDGRARPVPVRPDTIARSLAIGDPADGVHALETARTTGGSVEAVTDDEIVAGIRLLAETTGIFTETAGGVATAVLARLADRGTIDRDERVVLVITGDGLKTTEAVTPGQRVHRVAADVASVAAACGTPWDGGI